MSTMTTEAHEVMAAQGVNYGDTTVEDLFDVPPEVDESAPTIVCVRSLLQKLWSTTEEVGGGETG